ncbi:aminoglycoside 6'-N-acetyltransferase [Oryzifoliimicrobium ureilyticus]|uniref:aminoglycoside 6'-N-acetyltransferase n=1 Tax=Oryzifoliimicrobium ureilyticus TaxID=3113724 RepID=UPI00307607F3
MEPDPTLRIERATRGHVAQWAQMRAALWPSSPTDKHAAEIAAILADEDGRLAGFLAIDEDRRAVGFAEASLRHNYVNGCSSSPVLFLEGIYVEPDRRLSGVARLLCAAVEDFGRQRGVSEFASDARADNKASHAMHEALGFRETERVVFFRKVL